MKHMLTNRNSDRYNRWQNCKCI